MYWYTIVKPYKYLILGNREEILENKSVYDSCQVPHKHGHLKMTYKDMTRPCSH